MAIKPLNESNIKNALDTPKKVLIDFYANWCNSCINVDRALAEFSEENPDIDVYRLNVDENMDIANLYGIMNVPTILVMENKKVKSKACGDVSKSEIEELIL